LAETNEARVLLGPGAKVLPGPGSDREEMLHDMALGELSATQLAAIRQAESRALEVFRTEKFADLFIMQPLARASGLNEIAMHAFRKYLEVAAAGYSYDPDTGEPTAVRTTLRDAQTAKIWADQYRAAVRDAVELSGEMPGRLGDRWASRVIQKHRDPKSPEQLEAERAEREARRAEREANDPILQLLGQVREQVMERVPPVADGGEDSKWALRWKQIEDMQRDLGPLAPEVLAAKERFEADFEAEYVADEYEEIGGEVGPVPEPEPEPAVGPLEVGSEAATDVAAFGGVQPTPVLSAVVDLPQEKSPMPSAPPPDSGDGEWVWED
jgi:hypothetical protein